MQGSDRLRVEAAASRRHQFTALLAEPLEFSATPPEFLLETPRGADVGALALEWREAGGARARAEMFYKDYRGRPAVLAGGFGVPPGDSLLGVRGKAYGALVSANLPLGEAGTLEGSYAFQRSRDRVDGEGVPSDWEVPHDLSLLGSVRVARGLALSAVLRFRSGLPFTRVLGSVPAPAFPGASPRRREVGGPQNGARLPEYFRLDLGARREWRWTGARWAAFFQILNVTDERNPLELDIRELRQLDVEGDVRHGLPLVPSAGLEVRW